MEDLEKVTKKEIDLVICDNKKCPKRGDYIRCYFDIYVNCDTYQENKNNRNLIGKTP